MVKFSINSTLTRAGIKYFIAHGGCILQLIKFSNSISLKLAPPQWRLFLMDCVLAPYIYSWTPCPFPHFHVSMFSSPPQIISRTLPDFQRFSLRKKHSSSWKMLTTGTGSHRYWGWVLTRTGTPRLYTNLGWTWRFRVSLGVWWIPVVPRTPGPVSVGIHQITTDG